MVLATGTAAYAQRMPLIRDAEIESTIRSYATPIFRAAGLEPSAVEIYLIRDNTINAFVAGGQKLFINTGLLTRSTSPNQVIGIIAHEVGHIQGAHLVRVHDALAHANAEAIISMVLGAAAAVASGRPDVGSAIALGGQDMARRSFLRYSRTQEGSADAAAMRLLDATGQTSRGLLEFFQTLQDQELLAIGRQDPYLRTHPLTQDRIEALQAHVRKSRYAQAQDTPANREAHARMVAKLTGYLSEPSQTLRRYPDSDQSIAARYARAFAYHKSNDLQSALAEVDSLIAERPDDPYFHELKAQILFERGQAAEAIKSYELAVRGAPGSALIRTDLARAQMALEDPRWLEHAIYNLRLAVAAERTYAFAWRQLGIAYGRAGKVGESSWALAEEAALRNKWSEAAFHAGKAKTLLPMGSPEWLQAQDIASQAERKNRKGKK